MKRFSFFLFLCLSIFFLSTTSKSTYAAACAGDGISCDVNSAQPCCSATQSCLPSSTSKNGWACQACVAHNQACGATSTCCNAGDICDATGKCSTSAMLNQPPPQQNPACVKTSGAACTLNINDIGKVNPAGNCCGGFTCKANAGSNNAGTCVTIQSACIATGQACQVRDSSDTVGNCCNTKGTVTCYTQGGSNQGTCVDSATQCKAEGATGCNLPGTIGGNPANNCCQGVVCSALTTDLKNTVCQKTCADTIGAACNPNQDATKLPQAGAQGGDAKQCCAKDTTGQPMSCIVASCTTSVGTCQTGQTPLICASPPPPPPPPCENAAQLGATGATGGCDSVSTAFGKWSTKPDEFVKDLFGVLLGLAGGIAVLIIMIAGYRMMLSQGDPEKTAGAKEALTAAIVGLLFLIFSFVILQIIGVDLLNLPGFGK